MSKTMDIFVEVSIPLKRFVGELERLLLVKFDLVCEAEEKWYEYGNEQVVVSVGEHDFVDDRTMQFENYRYHISVRARKIGDENERTKWRNDFATSTFIQLKSKNKYALMLVYDLQKKLEEYRPDNKESFSDKR